MTVKRVLVIDDEPDILMLVQKSLQLLTKWQVSIARSGKEGLAMAERDRPDGIILDMMMPEMDGMAVFERLQAQEPTRLIPVFLLTAKVQMVDQQAYAKAGFRQVIAKPFDPPVLVSEISRSLGWD